MGTATVYLRRNGTVIETRTVTDVSISMQFILADSPGVGTHLYDILVDDGTNYVQRRDMIAIVAKK